MPNRRRRFPVQIPALSAHSTRPAGQSAILAKTLSANRFCMPVRSRTPGIRLGGRGFQKINKGLRETPELERKEETCALHKCLDFFCALHYIASRQGAGTSRQVSRHQSGKRNSIMVKVEDIQQYGKEH